MQYVVATEAAKETIWLSKLATEMRPQRWFTSLCSDVNLYCDSQSVLHLASNYVMDGRIKHIDIWYHYVIQAVSDSALKLIKIDGKLNPAYTLTKVISLQSFSKHCAKLQILHRDS